MLGIEGLGACCLLGVVLVVGMHIGVMALVWSVLFKAERGYLSISVS